MVAFSSFARVLEECLTIHSPPALFFKVEISPHTLIALFYARISPQWLNKLRQLWLNVPDKFHVSLFPNRFPNYAWKVA